MYAQDACNLILTELRQYKTDTKALAPVKAYAVLQLVERAKLSEEVASKALNRLISLLNKYPLSTIHALHFKNTRQQLDKELYKGLNLDGPEAETSKQEAATVLAYFGIWFTCTYRLGYIAADRHKTIYQGMVDAAKAAGADNYRDMIIDFFVHLFSDYSAGELLYAVDCIITKQTVCNKALSRLLTIRRTEAHADTVVLILALFGFKEFYGLVTPATLTAMFFPSPECLPIEHETFVPALVGDDSDTVGSFVSPPTTLVMKVKRLNEKEIGLFLPISLLEYCSDEGVPEITLEINWRTAKDGTTVTEQSVKKDILTFPLLADDGNDYMLVSKAVHVLSDKLESSSQLKLDALVTVYDSADGKRLMQPFNVKDGVIENYMLELS